MEDILSSIRRIISEGGEHEEVDKGAPEPAESADVLELTKMVDEEGNLVELSAEEDVKGEPAPEAEEPPSSRAEVEEEEVAAAPAPRAPEPAEEEAETEPEEAPAPLTPAEGAEALLSSAAAEKASQALSALARQREPEPHAGEGLRIVDSGRTIEEYVLELLRPMLKKWLDENLPQLVERLVRKEIEKLSRRADPL